MFHAVDKMMSLQDFIDSYVNGIIDRSQGVCNNEDTLAIHSYIYTLIKNGHSLCKYRTYNMPNFKNSLLLHIFEQNCPEEARDTIFCFLKQKNRCVICVSFRSKLSLVMCLY